jgi:hypothetical protein
MYTFNDHQTVSRCSVTSEAQVRFLNLCERFVYEAVLGRFVYEAVLGWFVYEAVLGWFVYEAVLGWFVYEAVLGWFCIHLSSPFTSIPPLRHTLLHLHAARTVRTHRQRMGPLQNLILFLNLGTLDIKVKGFKLFLAIWCS